MNVRGGGLRRAFGRRSWGVLGLALATAACSAQSKEPPPAAQRTIAPAPTGPLAAGLVKNLEEIFSDPGLLAKGSIPDAARSGDVRVAWLLVDLLRFHQEGPRDQELVEALRLLTGVRFADDVVEWGDYSDLLLANDVPAPPGYLALKRKVFLTHEQRWEPFFDDDAALDWREVSWGGVLRDAIEALRDPPVVPAREGGWLPDDDIVFGVVVGGAARAYPRRVMEVHELVNDSIGGRRIAMPYCTLCGAAIGYFTDRVPGLDQVRGVRGPLEFRTSGLLKRSNKLMYAVQTESLFDQFAGVALSGRMRTAGVKLLRTDVVTTTWGEWKAAHPETTVIAEGAGTGRTYDPNPLGDRDANGPIFPVGKRDPRLPAQTVVFGAVPVGGAAVAFPSDEARAALRAGRRVALGGIELRLEAGGLSARASEPGELRAHEAFWFAWSQFHPGTLLWEP